MNSGHGRDTRSFLIWLDNGGDACALPKPLRTPQSSVYSVGGCIGIVLYEKCGTMRFRFEMTLVSALQPRQGLCASDAVARSNPAKNKHRVQHHARRQHTNTIFGRRLRRHPFAIALPTYLLLQHTLIRCGKTAAQISIARKHHFLE